MKASTINTNSIRVPLKDKSVHCVVTSPPYWGLRDYGLPPTIWPAVEYMPMAGLEPLRFPGDPNCKHVWGNELKKDGVGNNRNVRGKDEIEDAFSTNKWENTGNQRVVSAGHSCQRCGAWRGCLGLEPTPEMFVAHIVAVFREVRRVLRDDGTLWLNFGDSYASGKETCFNPGGGSNSMEGHAKLKEGNAYVTNRLNKSDLDKMGLKPKDLCGIPWRVALALQADGWWLRSDIIWAKGLSFCDKYAGSCMPESVRDRCTRAHEYVFMLAKNKRYFWDREGVSEKFNYPERTYNPDTENHKTAGLSQQGNRCTSGLHDGRKTYGDPQKGRNLRDVWAINPGSYPDAHFATYPPDLVEPCIKAGTSEYGVCPCCGAPWERVVEKITRFESGSGQAGRKPDEIGGKWGDKRYGENILLGPVNSIRTVGWRPTCDCGTVENGGWSPKPVPATVLDPFSGSGTTGEVSLSLGRNYIGLDLSSEYCCDLANKRTDGVQLQLNI